MTVPCSCDRNPLGKTQIIWEHFSETYSAGRPIQPVFPSSLALPEGGLGPAQVSMWALNNEANSKNVKCQQYPQLHR